MSEAHRFQPQEILRRLVDADVQFIVIGGLAAQAHGSTSLTRDLDICFARDRANLDRLAAVLQDLAAIRRGLPADAPRTPPLDPRTLRAASLFTLETRFGPFGLLAQPDPGLDYEMLLPASEEAEIAGVRVRFAGLDDLIAMKRAAGRPKDRIELEILGALREEIDRRGAQRRSPRPPVELPDRGTRSADSRPEGQPRRRRGGRRPMDSA